MVNKYNAQQEDPQLLALANEHVQQCRACNQRAASHHLGVGNPLEDVQIEQSLELSTNILQQITKLLDPKVSLKENKWFFLVGALIVYTAQLFQTLLALP